MKLLVANGADVNAVKMTAATPPCMAHGGARGFRHLHLADHGAKMDIREQAGSDPYEVALGIGMGQQNGIARPTTAALIQRLSTGPSAKN